MIKSIMVVDDSKVQCEHAVQLCQCILPDVEIRQVYHGADALKALREKVCDIVVIDLEMPVMDGVELSEYIAQEKLANSIIICSSKDKMLIESVGSMCESNGLHLSGVIAKPVSKDALETCFNKYRELQQSSHPQHSSAEGYLEFSKDEIIKGINENQFELFYQPKLTTKGLLLKGVEALARWKHPDHGYVPPLSFIGIAEEWDLIDDLTFCLLDRGLDFINEVRRRGIQLSTAFNLSPKSIAKKGFCERIHEIALAKEADPKAIVFEITENHLADNIATFLSSLARLRLHGYGISIDDFGSQYANYELLSKLPITELKIDRSMVDDVSASWAKKNILESIVSMASKLNLATVAEGVETLEDYKSLASLGVDVIQGYYIAKPIAQEDLITWISFELAALRAKLKLQ